MPRKQHTKQFKLDAINYRKEHPDLTQLQCAKNLGIGISTLARWESQYRNNDGFVYLNCVMDLLARKIIAWTLADTMEVSTVIKTIEKAKAIRNTDLPLIIHTDRGSQYVSQAWREATKNMQRSYSHKGYPYDNACIESFHSLIKREWLNRFNIKNYRHAYNLIFEYIETFYNTVRIHSHCDYMSPDEFEKLYERAKSLPAA